MPDWNLLFSYSGKAAIYEDLRKYLWSPKLSFFIEWKPLGMVKTKVENKTEGDNNIWSSSTSAQG